MHCGNMGGRRGGARGSSRRPHPTQPQLPQLRAKMGRLCITAVPQT